MLNCYAVVCQCRPRLFWFWLLTHLCVRTTAQINPLRYHPRYDGSGHRIDSSGRRLLVRQSVDLLRWTMNMNSGSLTLQFNAGMDVSTLNASRIIIQASRTRQPGDQYVRLTEGNTTSSSVDGQDVGVTLAKEDWYNLQRAFNVATSRETAWIVIEKGMLRDGANTESNELLNGNAMQAATFQKDYTAPRLISHDLDMNGAGFGSSVVGFLTLRFDEVVDTTSMLSDMTHRRCASWATCASANGNSKCRHQSFLCGSCGPPSYWRVRLRGRNEQDEKTDGGAATVSDSKGFQYRILNAQTSYQCG